MFNKQDRHHGAALIQIVRYEQFTAINSCRQSANAYRINDEIGLLIKYRELPSGPRGEYLFTFNRDQRAELIALRAAMSRVFVALVCAKAKEICCLSLNQLGRILQARRQAVGSTEEQYTLAISAPAGRSFRAYTYGPEKRGDILGRQIVRRNAFPKLLFE